MSKKSFSPGPWHVTKDWQKKIRDKNNRAVAETVLKNKGNYQDNYKLQIANANLIATAPELYDFVNFFLTFAGQILLATLGDDGKEIYNDAARLIVKADGGKDNE